LTDKRDYRWNAGDYAQHSAAQREWGLELAGRLGLRGDESILDIGCGDGKLTAYIASQLPRGRVVGIDSSEAMIGHAAMAFPASQHGNLRFELMDAVKLSFEDEFDAVFSNATLHWVKDHLPVLRCIHRALKPGGKLLLQMGGRGNARRFFVIVSRLIREDPWRQFFDGFIFPYGFHGVDKYRTWLREAHLEALRVELIPKDMRQKGPAGLAAWVRTTWLPYTERVPEELRETLINEVITRYVTKHPPDADGWVHVPMVRLEVEAERH
jgi:trans-aconitate 2-methyltransferase